MAAAGSLDRTTHTARTSGGRAVAPVSVRHLGSVLGLLAVTVLLYAPSLDGEYVYEDMRDAGLYEASTVWPGWRQALRLEPTGGTAFVQTALIHLTEMSPQAQRVVSLAWHLVNGALLWTLARAVLSPGGALLATGLFLWHPIQTESVAYIGARSELLVVTAVLLALLAAERGWGVAAWLLAASAVMGKHAGVVALGLVPLWAWWRRLPMWSPTTCVLWGVACWTPLLAILAYVQMRGLLWASPEQIAGTLAAWTRLLALWVVPLGQTIDHDWAAIAPVWGWLALAGWGLAVVWAVVRRGTWWSLAVLWSAAVVLPRALWQLGDGVHEHHLMTPSIALSLATGALVTQEARHGG